MTAGDAKVGDGSSRVDSSTSSTGLIHIQSEFSFFFLYFIPSATVRDFSTPPFPGVAVIIDNCSPCHLLRLRYLTPDGAGPESAVRAAGKCRCTVSAPAAHPLTGRNYYGTHRVPPVTADNHLSRAEPDRPCRETARREPSCGIRETPPVVGCPSRLALWARSAHREPCRGGTRSLLSSDLSRHQTAFKHGHRKQNTSSERNHCASVSVKFICLYGISI